MNIKIVYWQVAVLAMVALVAAGFVINEWRQVSRDYIIANDSILHREITIQQTQKDKPAKQTVKGLYLTAYSVGDSKKLTEIIRLIDATELNAVVIDIKDYSGLVFYNSKLVAVKELKLKNNRLGDVRSLVRELHDHKIYVIARQTIFQDPALAAARPEWAIKDKNGGVWRDHKGLAWIDPTRREVWKYNLAIAKETASLGFDEINFDYIRFPSDGDLSTVVYDDFVRKKYQTMAAFYRFVSQQMASQPVWTSFDLFGLVMEARGENDLLIGQRLVDAVDNSDYICPMMYPSHYPPGHIGLKNPADYPEKILEHGLKLGAPIFKGRRAQLRPWIQAFNLGAIYDAEKIRAQIDEVEKYTSAGWLMWNASNRYSEAGLKGE